MLTKFSLILTFCVACADAQGATVRGVVTPSAGGTLQLRARNETGATAVTIRAGSLATMETYPL